MPLIDAILKATIIVSTAIASISIGYYYLVYLPERDKLADASRKAEISRTENERAEQRRQSEATAKAAEMQKRLISNRYQSCTRNARESYDLNWSERCSRVAETNKEQLAECLKTLPKDTCTKLYRVRDTSNDCSLPRALADSLNADYEKAKARCLQEFQAGIH
jgi:hypothetical protein